MSARFSRGAAANAWPLPNGRCEPDVYATVTHSLVRTAVAGAIAWLALAGLLAVQFWPSIPTTTSGWVLFVLLAPPACLLLEGVVDRLWATRAGRAISGHPSFAVRIMGGVLTIGSATAVMILLAPR